MASELHSDYNSNTEVSSLYSKNFTTDSLFRKIYVTNDLSLTPFELSIYLFYYYTYFKTSSDINIPLT